MGWGRGLIIFLGLMQLASVAQAREIETFTDSQGILHITNAGSKQQGSPASPPSPPALLRPSTFPRKAPAALPAAKPAPEAQAPASNPEALAPVPDLEAQAPAPQPEAVPDEKVPGEPQPGSRVTHPEDPNGVMLAGRTGKKAGPGAAAESPGGQIRRVSWSPPQPVLPSSEGKIVVRRDRQGVIHITNVELEEAPLMAPAPPAPAVRKQARAPAMIRPAVHEVSCPELGPEVAAYLEGKLLSHSPVWTGQTVRRYRDPQGVWHIVNAPAPDLQSPEAPLAASAGPIAVPAAAHDPPVTPTSPAMAWGPGSVKPSSGAPAPMVVAQRDRRGVVHIFTQASAELIPDRDSPVNFLRRVSPALQSCIIEAAELYQLPIPLILALIRQESNFTHQAVSPKGAMGLMQLMPATAASLGVRDPFDPRENILAGCRYFRQLLDYFRGNVPLALAGYNAGYNRVISAGHQVPAIKETQEFVTQVMGIYCLLEKHASGL
ncbi:MAG TPA: lytic transglycosylase domain-containing protein [Desulfobaccales bacterium]|nr:lytic transglycosylase domain-containing protein [Desulfobaccales bacterium]